MTVPVNPFKNQYTANGVLTDFDFTFLVVQGRSVNVYLTPVSSTPNEDTDLQVSTSYTVVLNNPSNPSSTGKIILNVAPAADTTVTVTPDNQTGVTYSFSNTQPLNQDNLNRSYSQQSSTISEVLNDFLVESIRYNANERNSNLNYINRLQPLTDGGFWRRSGETIESQDYSSFIEEVEADISQNVAEKVNAGADNTNLGASITSNPVGVEYSGNVKTVDGSGNVVLGPLITGYSASTGAYWAREWAVSPSPIADDYGRTGNSAKFYADQANAAANAAGGVIDELRVKDAVSTISAIDLVKYNTSGNPTVPWINVLENSMSVYLDGVRLKDPLSYSPTGTDVPNLPTYAVTVVPVPTLLSPSHISFSAPVAAGVEILIARSEAQGNSGTMRIDSSNATFTGGSLLMGRDGTNAIFNGDTTFASRDLGNVPFLFRQNTGVSKSVAPGESVDSVSSLGVWAPSSGSWSGLPASVDPNGFLTVERLNTTSSYYQTYRPIATRITLSRSSVDGVTWSGWVLQGIGRAGDLLYTSTPTAPMGYSLLNGSTLVGGWITLADLAASGSVLITQSGNDMVFTDVAEFLRPLGSGPDSRVLGTLQGDTIRNIIGTFSGLWGVGSNGTGPFTSTRNAVINPSNVGGNPPSAGKYTFNASTSVPVSKEVRPVNRSVNLCIYHGVPI